jgi:hypothetical protein
LRIRSMVWRGAVGDVVIVVLPQISDT